MKSVKQIIVISTILVSNAGFSQVIIGGITGRASVITSVLLDFPANENKGIILPYVRDKSGIATEGTIILDAMNSGANSRVKFYNGVSGDGWVDLSGQDANISTLLTNTQPNLVTESGKTVIGDVSTAPDGVLVLESATKALVLPAVTDVNLIPNPSPGMMVYVTGANKRLAVFNGSIWSFWKP